MPIFELLGETFFDPRDARWTFFGVIATSILTLMAIILSMIITIALSLGDLLIAHVIIFIVIILIVILISFILLLSQEILKEKKLVFEIHSAISATHPDISASVRKYINITYDAGNSTPEPVKNLFIIVLGIRNIGNRAVKEEDFQIIGKQEKRSLEFTFGNNAHILDIPGNTFQIIDSGKKISISPMSLAKKEYKTFKILVDQPEDKFEDAWVQCNSFKDLGFTIQDVGTSIGKNKKFLDNIRDVVLIAISIFSIGLCCFIYFVNSYNPLPVAIAFLLIGIVYYHILLFKIFNIIVQKYIPRTH